MNRRPLPDMAAWYSSMFSTKKARWEAPRSLRSNFA